MITIKPTFWQRKHVMYAVAIGAFCLIPAAFEAGHPIALMGPSVLVALGLMFWLMMRPIRLEISEAEVRAREGWARAPLGRRVVFRSELRSVHYLRRQVSFRGADGQSLMEAAGIWTVADMVGVAQELGVPLFDDRVGALRTAGPGQGRLMYDPVSGTVAALSRKQR